MQEFIKEEIKRIADKISFLRNILLALISGISGVLFAITQNKIILNFSFIILMLLGIVLGIFISIRINFWENERENLINKLKDVQ